RQITASTLVVSAIIFAPEVSSKLPGTIIVTILASCAPCFTRVSKAPLYNAPVIAGFHSDTTIPNFISLAEGTLLGSYDERSVVAISYIIKKEIDRLTGNLFMVLMLFLITEILC